MSQSNCPKCYTELEVRETSPSDVQRDGFFAELRLCTGAVPLLLAEAFWSDVTNEFTITFGNEPVPFSVLEEFVAVARQRVPPSTQPRE